MKWIGMHANLFKRVEKKVGKHLIHDAVAQYATEGRVLDLGCGNSPLSRYFPNRVGVDIEHGPGVDIIADAHDLPFDEASFDQIVCTEVLEHLHTPDKAVSEMARILRPGGTLVATVPFVYPLHEAPHDYQRYTKYGLEVLLQPYFQVKRIDELFTEEQTIAVLLQRIAFQRADSEFRSRLYHMLAHLIFRLAPRSNARRFQNIGRQTSGNFLTAGYLVVATK